MIQEKLKALQNRQKSYHDKKKKTFEFLEGDHEFSRVTRVTGVGQALKSQKLKSRFIGPYQIMKRVGEVAYRIELPSFLLNLHDVFHVYHPRKYIIDVSHVIRVDDVQVRENLVVETSLFRVYDREVKYLKGNEIMLVKVVWGGPAGRSMTLELDSHMREWYPTLFPLGKFRGQKFSKWGRVITPRNLINLFN
ncbi:uncharacterized protein LOC127102192 [Lathyrus oleraceus]|uniref:uncharacterized protein LOC127102192 n=1 Tax=Pisum sativum TaxID=3888 RepID=UPI0021CE09DB|nr:uncharacterized protein LOC127102192 [Pisum sativum]